MDFLDTIYEKAKNDIVFLQKLLNTRNSKNMMLDFCTVAQNYGIFIVPGDFLAMGETYSCNQMKSTNGGGVSPYAFFDDPFEMLMVQLEQL